MPGLTRRLQMWMCLVGLAAVTTSVNAAECSVLDRTTNSLPKLTTDDLYAVGAGPLGFFAVGANGAIASSIDGTDWRSARSISPFTLYSVVVSSAGVLTVGQQGITIFSADGVAWEASVAGRSNLNGVAYGNATFVAVGDGGKAYTTVDGKTWAAQATGTSNNLVKLAYGSGVFVAASAANDVHVSPDGTNWTRFRLAAPLTNLRAVNGGFFGLSADQRIASSLDGRVWSLVTTNTLRNVTDIGTDGQQLFAVGSRGLIARSTPTLGWNTLPVPAIVGGRDILGVASQNGQGIAVGQQGMILGFNTSGSVTNLNNDKFDDLASVAFGGGMFVAVGKSGRITVGDALPGGTWQHPNSGTSNDLAGVTYGLGRFVAVGGYPTNGTSQRHVTILTSVNATDWSTVLQLPGLTNAATKDVTWPTSVTFGQDRFVSVSPGGASLISTNGTEWSVYWSGALSNCQQVTYAAGQFIAVGGQISYSKDGISWNGTSVPEFTNLLSGVAGTVSNYVAVGVGPMMLGSTNLLLWTPGTLNIRNGVGGVGYGADQFVAVGAQGRAATSWDAKTWSVWDLTTQAFLRSVAFGNGKFVVVGDRGTLIYTEVVDGNSGLPGPSTWVRTSGGSARDAAAAAAIDSNCGYFVTGNFQGSYNFGGTPLAATGDPSFFIARYTDIGAPSWASTVEGVAMGTKISSQSGSVFVGGLSPAGVTFPGGEVLPSEGVGSFVASYDPTGAPVWSRQFPGTLSDLLSTRSGTVKFSGLFPQRMVFGEELIMEPTNNPLSFFLIKADSGPGTNIWGRYIIPKNNGFLDGLKIASDSKAATYAAGTAGGVLEFWTATLLPPVEAGENGEGGSEGGWTNILDFKLTNAPGVFLSKYDPNGKFLWAVRTPLTNGVVVNAAPDGSDGVLLAGNRDSLMFIAKFATNGAVVWNQEFDSHGSAQLTAFTTTTDGTMIGAGFFQSELTLGDVTLTTGGTASFVFHMDKDGRFLNVRSYGTAPALQGYSAPTALAAISTSEYVLAGYYDERVSFGPGDLVTRGLTDAFLARLRPPPAVPGTLTLRHSDDGGMRFEFPKGYVLQNATSVDLGDWVTIPGVSPIGIPPGQRTGFYRLIWP